MSRLRPYCTQISCYEWCEQVEHEGRRIVIEWSGNYQSVFVRNINAVLRRGPYHKVTLGDVLEIGRAKAFSQFDLTGPVTRQWVDGMMRDANLSAEWMQS